VGRRKYPVLYVDSEGVERGYYVYAHAAKADGVIFYVGKGHGARAWNKEQRSQAWKDHVASLTDGYDVVLLKTDLSELESFEEEKEAIQKHGGHAADGGTLINWIPGGEVLGFEISIGNPAESEPADTSYWDTRQFKTFSRAEQETFARKCLEQLSDILKKLRAFCEKAEEDGNDEAESLAGSIVSELDEIADAASHLLSRRISWRTFCFAIEDGLDQLELMKDDGLPKGTSRIWKESDSLTRSLLAEVDTGNRKAAQDASLHEWAKRNGGDIETAMKRLKERMEAMGIAWPPEEPEKKPKTAKRSPKISGE
jgi:hypothetical protein